MENQIRGSNGGGVERTKFSRSSAIVRTPITKQHSKAPKTTVTPEGSSRGNKHSPRLSAYTNESVSKLLENLNKLSYGSTSDTSTGIKAENSPPLPSIPSVQPSLVINNPSTIEDDKDGPPPPKDIPAPPSKEQLKELENNPPPPFYVPKHPPGAVFTGTGIYKNITVDCRTNIVSLPVDVIVNPASKNTYCRKSPGIEKSLLGCGSLRSLFKRSFKKHVPNGKFEQEKVYPVEMTKTEKGNLRADTVIQAQGIDNRNDKVFGRIRIKTGKYLSIIPSDSQKGSIRKTFKNIEDEIIIQARIKQLNMGGGPIEFSAAISHVSNEKYKFSKGFETGCLLDSALNIEKKLKQWGITFKSVIPNRDDTIQETLKDILNNPKNSASNEFQQPVEPVGSDHDKDLSSLNLSKGKGVDVRALPKTKSPPGYDNSSLWSDTSSVSDDTEESEKPVAISSKEKLKLATEYNKEIAKFNKAFIKSCKSSQQSHMQAFIGSYKGTLNKELQENHCYNHDLGSRENIDRYIAQRNEILGVTKKRFMREWLTANKNLNSLQKDFFRDCYTEWMQFEHILVADRYYPLDAKITLQNLFVFSRVQGENELIKLTPQQIFTEHQELIAPFFEFCKTKHNEENLLAYIDLIKLEKILDVETQIETELKESLNQFIKRYISEDSPLAINLKGSEYKDWENIDMNNIDIEALKTRINATKVALGSNLRKNAWKKGIEALDNNGNQRGLNRNTRRLQ